MRILVLDDMEIRHETFRKWFAGHTIDEALDAPTAIRFLNENKYTLAFLDHDLAEEHYSEAFSYPVQYSPGTGLDVARHIASMPKDAHPYIVVIHSWNQHGSSMMFDTLRDAGVFVVRRPFNADACPVVLRK